MSEKCEVDPDRGVFEKSVARVGIFDLEIRRSVDDCGGWKAVISKGGVSLGCIWDEIDLYPHFYDDNDLEKLAEHLEKLDFLVTFNGKGFDVPLVEAHIGRKLSLKSHFDLFAAVKEALDRSGIPWKGHGLGPLCERTLGRGKLGTGEGAPLLLASGKVADLVNYCLSDVMLTLELLEHAVNSGFVVAADGSKLFVDVPEDLKSAL